MVLWLFFLASLFSLFFVCISSFLFFVWFCASEGGTISKNLIYIFVHLGFLVFFHFSHFFYFVSWHFSMHVVFLIKYCWRWTPFYNAIFGWTFVNLIGFGIIFLSLKMIFTLLGHFILDFVNLVGLGVAFFHWRWTLFCHAIFCGLL
jgi:hypothetical protein